MINEGGILAILLTLTPYVGSLAYLISEAVGSAGLTALKAIYKTYQMGTVLMVASITHLILASLFALKGGNRFL